MGVMGLHSLNVTGSASFEEFLNNSTNVLVPKVGSAGSRSMSS